MSVKNNSAKFMQAAHTYTDFKDNVQLRIPFPSICPKPVSERKTTEMFLAFHAHQWSDWKERYGKTTQ